MCNRPTSERWERRLRGAGTMIGRIKPRRTVVAHLMALSATACATAVWGQTAAGPNKPAASPKSNTVSEVVVTASRRDLLGLAVTASQGSVTQEEVKLRPIYRIGELYETVPGLTVTLHSGEGKANQYLMRGFNLDHGTDFASFVDDMPVNRGTNAHGQGYSDQSFLHAPDRRGLRLHQRALLRGRRRLRRRRVGACQPRRRSPQPSLRAASAPGSTPTSSSAAQRTSTTTTASGARSKCPASTGRGRRGATSTRSMSRRGSAMELRKTEQASPACIMRATAISRRTSPSTRSTRG